MTASLEKFPTTVRIVGVREFGHASFDRAAPLVVRGAVARARRKWTDKWLLRRFGHGSCAVSLDSRPAMHAFKTEMPLRQFLGHLADSAAADRPPAYLFHSRQDIDGAADLIDDLDVPAAILRLGKPTLYRFYVGPSLTGTLPHVHTYAVNALARGRKRWAVYVGATAAVTRGLVQESHRAYSGGSQARDWFVHECPRLRRSPHVRLWEFSQEPGDLVYLPAFFIHAVVNLEPVVGFTVEFQPHTTSSRGLRSGGIAQQHPTSRASRSFAGDRSRRTRDRSLTR